MTLQVRAGKPLALGLPWQPAAPAPPLSASANSHVCPFRTGLGLAAPASFGKLAPARELRALVEPYALGEPAPPAIQSAATTAHAIPRRSRKTAITSHSSRFSAAFDETIPHPIATV